MCVGGCNTIHEMEIVSTAPVLCRHMLTLLTKEADVDLVSEAVLEARSSMELVMEAEAGDGTTEMEWDLAEAGVAGASRLEVTAAMEFDLRLDLSGDLCTWGSLLPVSSGLRVSEAALWPPLCCWPRLREPVL